MIIRRVDFNIQDEYGRVLALVDPKHSEVLTIGVVRVPRNEIKNK